MTTKPHAGSEGAFAHATDAFLALSEIYLESAERLSHSTLAVARAALEECTVATRAAAAAKGPADPAALPLALGQSLLEKALAYTRDSYETVTQAQLEAALILGRQFAAPPMRLPVPEDWKGALDMLTRGLRDLSKTASASFVHARDAAWKFPTEQAPQLNKAA